MAYVSQEKKQSLAPAIKAILKKHGLKGSLSVRHHSALVLTVKSGKIDFISNYNAIQSKKIRPDHLPFHPASDNLDVNPYWYHEHFDGKALEFLKEVIPAMKGPEYFDHSDIQSDYFHCSHYFDVQIGKWDKPYILEK
jgi:hypothetical protein